MLKLTAVNAVSKYLNEVRTELSKVIWPKRDEVARLTLVVFLVSAIVGAYIGGLDYVFTKLIEYLLAQG
jgi:preprotein translocase subunit SecE